MFDYDATGIEPSSQGQGKLLPKQWFSFEVIEHTTKDGSKTYPLEGYTKEKNYPKVDILAKVIDHKDYADERVFHSVTFMPKGTDGSGMAIHFLKTIGEPYEGKIKPNAKTWVGAKFDAYVIEDEYMGKKKNKFGEIALYGTKTKDAVSNSGLPF